MSIEALDWVLKHSPTKGAQRLVLLALANHADERGECYPSVERIASEANVTAHHAKRVLRELEAHGHVSRRVNAAPDERMRKDRRTNLYRLLHGGAEMYPPWLHGGDNGARTGGTSAHARGGSDVPPNRQGEPSPKPSDTLDAGAEGADAVLDELCIALADAIEAHGKVGRPTITTAWRRDMRLLIQRGELGIDGARGHPPEVVARAIGFTFERLADPGRDGFCWADQVRSPGALRRHWPKLAEAKRKLEQGGVSKGARTIDRVAERLADEQQQQRPALALLPPANNGGA